MLMIVGGIKLFENFVNIHGQRLNTYVNSSGGGMTGGYYRETVKRYEDYALICVESAKWHSQDPTVKEYLTDVTVLDELETIVRKYKMNFWNRKKFTNVFVHDGESTSYNFSFDDADVSFSSQIYPTQYRKKLSEFDSVVKKYIESGEKLPSLVNLNVDDEEQYSISEDELIIYVYSYALNSIGIKIHNDTDEDVELSETYKLINADTGVVLAEEDTPYGGRFNKRSNDEMDIRLKERLLAGNYKFIFGDWEIPFEIR